MKKNKFNFISLLFDYGLIMVLFLIIVAVSLVSKEFLTVDNFTNIIRQSCVVGIMAIGVTIVILAGHIDLSIGSTVSLAGIITMNYVNNYSTDWAGMALALLAGAGLGLVNGLIISIINGRTCDSFIVTFGMQTAIAALALIYSGGAFMSGRGGGVHSFLGKGSMPILIFILVVIIMYLIMKYTPFGRTVYFMGANQKAAKMSGINIKYYTTMIFVISGLLASLASIVLSSRVNAASPTSGKGYELDAIAAVVVGGTSLSGGKGGIGKTVLGLFVINILGNALNLLNITTYPQMIIRGVIIVAAVMLDVLGSKFKNKKKEVN